MIERLEAFTVRPGKDGGKDFWVRIGTAWPTKQNGWSLRLDALPINGEIVLSPPKPKDDNRPSGGNTGGGRRSDPDSDSIPFGPQVD